MPRARSVALTLILALLQLVLLESGYACAAMPSGQVADGAMASMSMPGMAMPEQANASDSPADAGGEQAPCTFPWAPNGCQTMAPCGPAAMVVATGGNTSDLAAHDGPLTLVELAPSSLSSAPELPPPRA